MLLFFSRICLIRSIDNTLFDIAAVLVLRGNEKTCVPLNNAIKLSKKVKIIEKVLDNGRKMCSQGLKTKRFSGRPHMKNTVLTLRERLFSIIRRLGEEPKRYARNPGRNFTRKRTLTPAVLIYLIVTMDEKSIWKGLLGHFRKRSIRRRRRHSPSSDRSCSRPRSKICFTTFQITCVRKRNFKGIDCWP